MGDTADRYDRRAFLPGWHRRRGAGPGGSRPPDLAGRVQQQHLVLDDQDVHAGGQHRDAQNAAGR